MALDFAILGRDGTPNDVVGIRAAVHGRLMSQADGIGLRLLSRANDFYGDADFAPSEVEALLQEARVLRSLAADDSELAEVLARLCELFEGAKQQGLGVAVIAD